jgi:dnd system-associated protein 4
VASFARVPERYGELLDLLVSQPNTSSAMAATKTGPFSEFREAFLFAASLGFALNREPKVSDASEKVGKTIRDEIFLRGEGAREVVSAFSLAASKGELQILDRSEEAQERRFAVLNGFAETGFEYLASIQEALPQSTIIEILIHAIQQVTVTAGADANLDGEEVHDPILALIAGRNKGA